MDTDRGGDCDRADDDERQEYVTQDFSDLHSAPPSRAAAPTRLPLIRQNPRQAFVQRPKGCSGVFESATGEKGCGPHAVRPVGKAGVYAIGVRVMVVWSPSITFAFRHRIHSQDNSYSLFDGFSF